jgi:hypothetical protein
MASGAPQARENGSWQGESRPTSSRRLQRPHSGPEDRAAQQLPSTPSYHHRVFTRPIHPGGIGRSRTTSSLWDHHTDPAPCLAVPQAASQSRLTARSYTGAERGAPLTSVRRSRLRASIAPRAVLSSQCRVFGQIVRSDTPLCLESGRDVQVRRVWRSPGGGVCVRSQSTGHHRQSIRTRHYRTPCGGAARRLSDPSARPESPRHAGVGDVPAEKVTPVLLDGGLRPRNHLENVGRGTGDRSREAG